LATFNKGTKSFSSNKVFFISSKLAYTLAVAPSIPCS
jgi:hypothetical protein